MRATRCLSKKALSYDLYHHGVNHAASAVSIPVPIVEQKSLVFLHGILGSKRNWRTPSNVFRKLHPEFKCVAVDFRGHGDSHSSADSEHQWEDNTIHNSAEDLYDLTHNSPLGLLKAPTILCAHSFGGKVALRYLEKLHLTGHELPEHTWILDSIPGPYRRVRRDSTHLTTLHNNNNM
jgi:pimeloyl-ACP methyl ester carboxylesterase